MLTVAAALSGVAHAEDFQSPNTLLTAAVGRPWLVSARAEAWIGDGVTGEVGVGALGDGAAWEGLIGVDWAIRWRPDALCFGCGSRNLLSVGVGPGGWVVPPLERDGVGLAAGGDLGLAYVHWLTRQTGFTVSGKVGGGAGWQDLEVADAAGVWWAYLGAGVAF